MKYWLISDTHFNHENIEKWGGRSGDWQEKLWSGLNKIPIRDILIHLGDVCIGNDNEVHNKIQAVAGHAKKILVLGNHDKKSKQWYHEHGWDFVCDGLEILFQGHYLHLTHRPARPQGNTTWNIHGHTHTNVLEGPYVNVCVEHTGYAPLSFEAVERRAARAREVAGG